MKFTTLDLVVVLVYLFGIGAVGIWQGRKVKSSGDFFAGGRKFNKFLMMMHSLGSGTHADDPVVVVGACYQRGLSGIWYTYVFLFITPFYWILSPFFRRSRFLTTTDFFETRYGHGLGFLYSIMALLTFTINMGTLLKGTGLITNAVFQGAIPDWVAILGMTIIFVAYGTAGGLVATVMTEAIQGLLIVVMSLLLVPFGLAQIGGFTGLHQLLDDSKFNITVPEELSLTWIIAATIANLIGWVAQPQIMETNAAGKTEWEGRVGQTYGSFIKRICALGWAVSGLIVLALVNKGLITPLDNRENAFGTAIRVLLPSGCVGLMFAAILAAQMSTLSSFMVASSAIFSRNIYQRYLNPGANDRQLILVARGTGIGIVLLSVVFSFLVEGVADALTIFFSIIPFMGLFIWAGVLWRRTNAMGVWTAFVTMVLIWLALGPVGAQVGPKLQNIFPAIDWLGKYAGTEQLPYLLMAYLPAGVIMLVLGSLIGRSLEKKKLDQFYALLRTPVGREEELVAQGVPIVYQGHSKGHPWELNHPRLVNIGGFFVALALSFAVFGVLWLLSVVGK